MCAKPNNSSFDIKRYVSDPQNKAKLVKILSIVLVVSVLCVGLLLAKRIFLDDNIGWVLSEDGVLTISGTGDIKDFDPLKPDEWLKLKSGESVKKIVIEEGITGIGNYAFYKCNKATEVVLPRSLKSVGDFAFMECTKLTGIKLKENVTEIGKGAFYNCTAAKTVELATGIKSIGYDAFYGTGYYNTADMWRDGVLYIGNYLVDVKTDAKGELVAKDGTTLVADYAFSQCTAIERVILPDETASVGKYAFNSCTSLKQVVFEGKLQGFSEGLFWDCYALEKISGPHIEKDPTFYEKTAGEGWSHNAGHGHDQIDGNYFNYTE
ncbi:MAG: leucine-rich repeat domain-containing protein [Clostridia bacterium]|nr:leucine-rich repeat domain-containing protein [Clostridia bacterium]